MCCYVNKFMPLYQNITLSTLFFLLKLYFPNEIFPENIVPEEMIEVFLKKMSSMSKYFWERLA